MSDTARYHDQSQNVSGSGHSNISYNNNGPAAPPRPAQAPETAHEPAPAPVPVPAGLSSSRARNVFVVHGRDEQMRQATFGLLRRLDLRPLEWEELVRATGKTAPYIGEVVANAPSLAQAAIVLLTPDDTAKLHPELLGDYERVDEVQYTGQPRQNVLIELGMVLMAYPERTILVEVGRLRHATDIEGLNVIRFDGSTTSLEKIVARLKGAGCLVDDARPDWRETSYFQNLSAYRRLP
ncbi:Predicted nucleotide-binding protein containing TIR-like domain-containing protein [Actinacidiphila alni]|uniref:Predicted nucleotide-binding protein containing TIR-like domain-containing protein n=1 Tax=Actinacidiphila alni TaxID=380248 RepID=A0A1I1ZLU1_9ACTN|nr:nucleotide-binding protein [Actinacidiphila alni]SFE32635.1 Predicted nucleotide-binding protein containing TIR-like domain-containing protein [Actinacidiphila alni]